MSIKMLNHKKGIFQYLQESYQLYLLMLPAIASIIIFCYWPIYGIQIAFRDFRPALGIFQSKWVGLEHFARFLKTPTFWRVVRNTFGISAYSLLAGFPIPIFLAILINEINSKKGKKAIQMITYAPHFISTVAICGMVLLFLKKDTGMINALTVALGGEAKEYITNPSYFWSIYVWSGIWQDAGWGTIIYLASLASVDPDIIEAATIDGANRLQKIRHIDLPTIMPTIVILMILSAGSLLGVGYEKVLLLQTSLNMDTSDVIATYTYRMGILGGQYDYTTAIGLFNALINAVLLVLVNAFSRRVGETSLW